MLSRPYSSPVRAAAAAEKRAHVMETAGRLLRNKENVAAVSMEAVARAAGVTRLTVYKQFGSRRALLEAVFDECAKEGGLRRIPEAMALRDPHEAIARIIDIFCDFWASDAAIARLHEATSVDREFAQAIAERNERRRALLNGLVMRVRPRDAKATRKGVVDLLFALTSLAMFQSLKHGRSKRAVSILLKRAAAALLESR